MITEFKIFENFNSSDIDLIYPILRKIRQRFLRIVQGNEFGLAGYCGQVSKEIIEELNNIGYDAKLVEGDFLINEDLWSMTPTGNPKPSLTNHIWVETNGYLIDVTHDQYSEAIEEKMPDIVFNKIENCLRYIRNEDEYWNSCEILKY